MASQHSSPDPAGPTPHVLMSVRLEAKLGTVLRHATWIEQEIPAVVFGYFGGEPPAGFMRTENQAHRTLKWAARHARLAETAFAAGDSVTAELHADYAKDLLLPGWVALAAADCEQARAEAVGKAAEVERAQAETAAQKAKAKRAHAKAARKTAEVERARTEAALQAANAERARAEAAAAKQAYQDAKRKRLESLMEGRKRASRRGMWEAQTEAIISQLHAGRGALPKRGEVATLLQNQSRDSESGKPLIAKRTAENYAYRAIAKLKKS
jgi:hypothetical protein